MIRIMQTCSLRGGNQRGGMQSTWDSTRWRRRHIWYRRSWTAVLKRCPTGRRRRKRRGGCGWKERSMRGKRRGKALADGRLSGINWRCLLSGDGLSVVREKARGLRWRKRRRSSGVLERLIDRHSPSSRLVLADLGVGCESHEMTEMLLKTKRNTIMQQYKGEILTHYRGCSHAKGRRGGYKTLRHAKT